MPVAFYAAWLPRSFTLSALNYRLQASSLLNEFLELLTDYRSVKAIDGDACHADSSRHSLARRRKFRDCGTKAGEASIAFRLRR
jgi:hypothetical protein